MKEPSFDIFSGRSDKDAVWIEAVQGLSNARARMHEIAAQTPGQYSVFSVGSRAVLAQTETFGKLEKMGRPSPRKPHLHPRAPCAKRNSTVSHAALSCG
jgi:hypothetical protein